MNLLIHNGGSRTVLISELALKTHEDNVVCFQEIFLYFINDKLWWLPHVSPMMSALCALQHVSLPVIWWRRRPAEYFAVRAVGGFGPGLSHTQQSRGDTEQ